MNTKIGVFEAKNRFSELLRRVKAGSRFTITNRGKPVAELGPPPVPKLVDVRAAIDKFLAFKASNPVTGKVDLRAAIKDGRA